MSVPRVSVVVATYERPESIERLVRQLGAQELAADEFEIVVVDDGSAEPTAPRLQRLSLPCALTVLTQRNAGAACARHRGIVAARGELVVVLDDDMQVGPEFLARHLSAHPAGSRRAVLGRLRLDPGRSFPLFERHHARVLDCLASDLLAGRWQLEGSNLYTGNVSFRREDYLAVGGFDPSLARSEDAELGIRLERAGVTLWFSEAAGAFHSSDHTSVDAWMRRAFEYGVWDLRIGRKHPDLAAASPWRFLFRVSPISRPVLLASVAVPVLAQPLARLAMGTALALDRIGSERLALAGATFVYGLEYFRGVRAEAGSLAGTIGDHRRYLRRRRAHPSRLAARDRMKRFAPAHAGRNVEVDPN
ncbi:MAG TPA: exopolysaccharide biosynthesis glycosyltransferase EpsD [Vicinamibacteria bacterium]